MVPGIFARKAADLSQLTPLQSEQSRQGAADFQQNETHSSLSREGLLRPARRLTMA
jgi:hypothetical protein